VDRFGAGVPGALRRLARSDFVRFGAIVFVAQSAANALNFLFHVLVSRRVGVAPYGELNALLAGLTILSVPAMILTTVVVKYASEFHALDDAPRLRALTLRVAARLGTIACAIVPIGALLSGFVADFFRISSRVAVDLTVVVIALNFVLPVLRGILQGAEGFRAYAASAILEVVVKVALAVVFTSIGWGIAGALAGWALGSAASLAYTLAVLFGAFGNQPRVPLALDLGRLARTSGGVAIATLLISAMGFGDVLFVKHFFPPLQAGLYGAGALAGKMLFWLVNFVPAVVLPRAAFNAARGRRAVPILLQALAAIALLAGSGLAIYALVPELVVTALAGGAFAPAAVLVFPYGIATTLLATLNTVVLYKLALHRFDFIVPLVVCALGEGIAIVLHHDTPQDVITVLIVGNALALAGALYRIGAPAGAPAVAERAA
jgi:O-antigen/teichoic acid export membrane protein